MNSDRIIDLKSYDEDILILLSGLTSAPGYQEFKKLLKDRLDGMINSLTIPYCEAAGVGPEAYISASSVVQGQIRELKIWITLLEMAEKVPRE